MKFLNSIIALILLASSAFAAGPTNNPPVFIKGALSIDYKSRYPSYKNKVGVCDTYIVNVNMSNSTVFSGTIQNYPLISGTYYGINQQSSLVFTNFDVSIINPRNPNEVKKYARLYGSVPITPEGLYQFDAGNLLLTKTQNGQQSKFTGTVQGRPLNRKEGWLESATMDVINLGQRKKGSIAITKYDKMLFQNHKLALGPLDIYPDAYVNGEMIYDYERGIWYYNNVNISYAVTNVSVTDRLTGAITWVEEPIKGSLRLGEYQFEVLINEPTGNEASVFATGAPADEAAIFETQSSNAPALIGTMKYKDTVSVSNAGGKEKITVLSSQVDINLIGRGLNKQQVMNLFKLLFFTSIVPVNAE